MPLQDILVRPDWRELQAKNLVTQVRFKGELQLALVAFGLLSLALASLSHPPPWTPLLQRGLFAACFLLLPVALVCAREQGAGATHSGLLLATVAAAVLAALTRPAEFRSPAWAAIPTVSPWLSLLLLPLAAGMLALVERRHEGSLRRLGLKGPRWGYHGAIGLACGVALGLHLWIVATAMPNLPNPRLPYLGAGVWLFFSSLAFKSLGEELTLRGLLYEWLGAEGQDQPGRNWLRLVSLALPLYVVPVMQSGRPGIWGIALTYAVLYSFLAIFLRFAFRSVAAPLAANVGFNVLWMLVVFA